MQMYKPSVYGTPRTPSPCEKWTVGPGTNPRVSIVGERSLHSTATTFFSVAFLRWWANRELCWKREIASEQSVQPALRASNAAGDSRTDREAACMLPVKRGSQEAGFPEIPSH
jgi:hypothetical protein